MAASSVRSVAAAQLTDRLAARVAEALRAIDAPDVVVAVSVHGRRVVLCGGTAPEPPVPRDALRYELGSASKTFTGLVTADLAASGLLRLDDPVIAHLPCPTTPTPLTDPDVRRITLRHLATHTSGLPRLPRDMLFGAYARPNHNSYTDYGSDRLLRAFARTRLRTAPGRRWHYSNFGVALLGEALCDTAGMDYPELLESRILRPLGLHGTTAHLALAAEAEAQADAGAVADADAMGHAGDGVTPVPTTGMGAFAPAAAVRATPGDLLTYLEAHLEPGEGPLSAALRTVRATQLEHGAPRRSAHTLGWFQHPAPHGPLLFHPGATFGQQAFAGLHPATGTAVAALATRRGRSCGLVASAYELLYALADTGTRTP